MRRSRIFLAILALLLITAGFLTLPNKQSDLSLQRNRRQLVAALMLTDLALWSEARYTRHPAMADLFSPFQDHPGALEHFPAGSLLAPSIALPETTLTVRPRRASIP